MRLISREELKKKMETNPNLKLAFVLGEWHYRAKHIPGSLNLDKPEKANELLDKNDEIVVYCANITCPASAYAYNALTQMGFKDVYRYAEGIQDWEEAGYPLEGESIDS